jgi:hypothetical protein
MSQAPHPLPVFIQVPPPQSKSEDEMAVREEQLTEALRTRLDAIPLEQIAAEVIELTDAESDPEEEVLEPEVQPKEMRDERKASVAYQMALSMLRTAMTGISIPSAREGKIWTRHILIEIATTLIALTDEASIGEVRSKVIDDWRFEQFSHDEDFTRDERKFRMYSQIALWLDQNGWAEDAAKYRASAQRRQSRAFRAQHFSAIWAKLIRTVAEEAFRE